MVLAVARERLLECHKTRCLELIERARGELSVDRALSIYCRVNNVQKDETDALARRVLAHLGSAPREPGRPDASAGAPPEVDTPSSWFAQIRRRLGGRKNHALRRWVELHTGRTQVDLLRIHVSSALRVMELRSGRSFADSAELYAERMEIPAPLARMIYFLALDRIGRLEIHDSEPDPVARAAGDEAPAVRTLMP